MQKQQQEEEEAGGCPGAAAGPSARVDYRVMDVTRMDGYADGSVGALVDKARGYPSKSCLAPPPAAA